MMKPEPRASIACLCGPICGPMPPNGNCRNGDGICAWSSSPDASACSLVVIETTAGFTCVTRSVKSGSAVAGHAAAGRIDRRAGRGLGCGEAGMADGEAAECGAGQQNAGHGGAAPMPWRARCLGGKGHGCSFGNFLDIQGGKPVWRRRHGRKCAGSGERSLGAAIKPLSCRLNLCHSPDRYGLDGYAAAWVGMGWRGGCDRAVASGTAKCLQKLAKWPNSRRRPTRWKVADEEYGDIRTAQSPATGSLRCLRSGSAQR